MAAKAVKVRKDTKEKACNMQKRWHGIWNFARGLAVWAAALFVGALLGYAVSTCMGNKTDDRLVAFRIGNLESEADYDLQCAVNFLEHKFKEAGFRVAGTAYSDDLYPKKLNTAGINVFVRGFGIFFDLRMNKNGLNVYYMHRFATFYAEELRHFDRYLSSQKSILEAVKGEKDIDLLPGGFVPHEALEPDYEYDVLYIYEYYNDLYDAFIQRYNNPKIYSGRAFADLGKAGREAELKKARLVVYEMGPVGKDDEIYVPYAVYDIMSYGRPLLTNRKAALTAYFAPNVWLFDEVEDMALTTNRALNTSDIVRERKAANARQILQTYFDIKVPFLEKLAQRNQNDI